MDNMTFEEAKKKLEEIVARIKNENCTLDEALKLYEEGVKLARFCDEKLSIFKTRLSEIVDSAGELDDEQ
ncbi:MAG: exodeoxyribonuclease VII small subunit [Erysipelotrichaceae bacterium]|nr:exodeoxyribonuclease VII small subunit [Erysipelotrichaceae bacterium]MBR2701562.1 exodeoxyribonuclease VII small subunit [Erysipelotrichaceae bacterium]MBR2746223.1 exodeoxyribonuclease VII small subunit [Erysipelotrichaceae bacterium]